MNIAIIGTAYPYRGGIATYNERLAAEFQDQGHEVTIFTFTKQYPDFLFPGKTQYSEEDGPRDIKIVRCINSINPLNWITVGNRIKNTKPDLVVIGFWLPLMGPCFGQILRRIKKNGHSIVLSILHNVIPHESRLGDRLFTGYFAKAVDGFVAMAQNVMDDIKTFDTTHPKILSPHPIYDNFGTVMPREEALSKLGLAADYNYILFFGLIRKYKGLDLLIEAFANEQFRNSNIRLIIAGEYYSDKDEYIHLINKYSLEDEVIQVDQFIPNSEVQYYFNACDLVVQPYRTATQSGVTQIAYHFNKPMIVTNVGGLEKMCPHGKVGYVVTTNPDDIADSIFKFFNKTDKPKMINNIIEEKKKYSWDILTQNMLELFEKVNIYSNDK